MMNKFLTTASLVLAFGSISLAGKDITIESTPADIQLNIAYMADSLWSEAEIQKRFSDIKENYERTCPGINLSLNELIRVEDKELQDIDGSLSSQSVYQIKKVLSLFKNKVSPTILYIRKGKWDFEKQDVQNFTDSIGKAYTFGGPRPLSKFENIQWNDARIREQSATGWEMGNLDWNRYEELKILQGVILIGQASSIKSSTNIINSDLTSVDRHELGHVLLNDGSHRDTTENYMSNHNDKRHRLDPDQCKLIQAYKTMESLRDISIKNGMIQLCALYEKHGIGDLPTYCASKK
ncbi:MAG: hypothetical protein JNM24_03710 [Bdellovibrionaceae bacterium]|nr:hypothetical protein [Pseudobdellovibrionaceae bacterium]